MSLSTDELGTCYERFVATECGYDLETDRDAQLSGRDTVCGIDFKYDRKLHETGNLWLEYAECRKPGGVMVTAGFAKAGCDLLFIGDCSRALFIRPIMLCNLLDELREGIKIPRDGKLPRLTLSSTTTSKAIKGPFEVVQRFAVGMKVFGFPDEKFLPLRCERVKY